ncbi:MAG: cupin domain-containing protein [Pseudomonadota bacterium]
MSSTPSGTMSQAMMVERLSQFPAYRAHAAVPARQYGTQTLALWGARLAPVMAAPGTAGRFAGAALTCPATACTGSAEMAAGAASQPYRNPAAIENIFCLDGAVTVKYGAGLGDSIELGRFDMVSVPANVKHSIHAGGSTTRFLQVLSTGPDLDYGAVFDAAGLQGGDEAAYAALGVRFDSEAGTEADAATLQSRITRAATLVPYKKELKNSAGIPAEATMMLSASSVCPLIVPTGHIGRSRTAPMYGNQGLYISIAECAAGDDGPPPHAHSDTQESFFVMEGEWDICTGFDNEFSVVARPYDIVAMPSKVMRTFRNRGTAPARLFVIIQGGDRMNDTVSFSRSMGRKIEERFGAETIEAYKAIRMTFDAEERLAAA